MPPIGVRSRGHSNISQTSSSPLYLDGLSRQLLVLDAVRRLVLNGHIHFGFASAGQNATHECKHSADTQELDHCKGKKQTEDSHASAISHGILGPLLPERCL